MASGKSNGFLFAGSSAIFAVLAVFASGLAKEPACDLKDVPPAAQQLVARQFPEWRMWDRSDLTDEELTFWLKQNKRSSCPGLAIGRFASKARLAYVMSLIPKDPSREGWRLLVIDKDPHGEYRTTVVEQHNDYTDTGILWTVAPGTYVDMYKSDKVTLRLDGFKSHIYGKGETLYYWKEGRYRSFVLAD